MATNHTEHRVSFARGESLGISDRIAITAHGRGMPTARVHRRFATLCALLAGHCSSGQTVIDFEHFPNGVVVPGGIRLTAQFQPWGILIEHDNIGRAFGGMTVQLGSLGTLPFGNSPVIAVDVGDYGGSTTVRFVDPSTGSADPASIVQVLLGDGDAGSETFSISAFDTAGTIIDTSECQRTFTSGFLYTIDAGADVIASIRMTLQPLGSGPCASIDRSGVVFDDLVFVHACPRLFNGPESIRACEGGTATFEVAATGKAPLSYQWRKDGIPLDTTTSPSAATAILVLNNVTPADITSYDCVITNSCGSITSNAALLTMRECPYDACPADYDASGGTPDSSDIGAFFTDWLAGAECADADCSGGTPDSADIDAFFLAWLAGGC